MMHSFSRSFRFVASNVKAKRCFSRIVTSRVSLPELSSPVVNAPLPHFILDRFLDKDRKDKVYLMDGVSTKTLTYGESYYASFSFADSLKDLGINKNDVVSVTSPNHLYYFSILMGTMLAGGVSSTVNPLYSAEEMQHQFGLTESRFYVTHALCLERVLHSTSNDKVVILMDEDMAAGEADKLISKYPSRKILRLNSLLSKDSKRTIKHNYDWKNSNFDPQSIAVIPFSSGTTGRSKGVMISHKNLVCNVLQTLASEGEHLCDNKQGHQRSLLIPLPFFHIFGLTAGLLVAAHAGSRHIFMPQFDLKRFLEIIQEYKVERAFVVPPIVLALAKHPMIDQYNLSSLEGLMSGAAPLGVDVQKAAAIRLKCIVKQAWGMTETSPAAAITPDSELQSVEDIKGTAGLLLAGTEGKIIDPVSGSDLDPSQEGELLVRGPQIMVGYYKNPEATAKTINKDGWLHTGDIARFDNGWLYITDRLKELIKYKGFQVPPAELEALILTMPDVKDAIVIPVSDEEAGEVPRAYVVKKDTAPNAFAEEHVIQYVEDRVAPHKRLRGGVFFVNEVPKSASGKLLRRVQIEIDRELHPTESLLK
jgi:acyl-CoA synthetase (AMP-forming)/AMP-acid ligase II